MAFNARDLRPRPGVDMPDQHDPVYGWIIAKPLPTLLRWRIRAAWDVLTGRAEALYWPEEAPRG